MRMRLFIVVLVGAAALAVPVPLAGAASSQLHPHRASPQPHPHLAGAPRPALQAQLWVERYNDPWNNLDEATAAAVDPDGSTIFVTGWSWGGEATRYDYGTVAYDAATGAMVWGKRYGADGDDDVPASLAVSPDGSKVFVTGSSLVIQEEQNDWTTVAYDAATGAQLWVERYDDPFSADDFATAAAVGPDGSTVYVTGWSLGLTNGFHYYTVAYNASNGTPLWMESYDGPAGGGADEATSLVVNPDGSAIFVTGLSLGVGTGFDYATVAYDASTGSQLWASRSKGPGTADDFATAAAVSPDGSEVFVTGRSETIPGVSTSDDYATIAYDASNGTPRWVKRYNGPGDAEDEASSMAVSPDGSKVFVTGHSTGVTSSYDYATIAYDASTGTRAWVRRYKGPGNADDLATAAAVSPDGSQFIVTGYSTGVTSSYDYATIAYDASTGKPNWVQRYDGPGNADDLATAVVVSPDGSQAFVTGYSTGVSSGRDYATVAYSTV